MSERPDNNFTQTLQKRTFGPAESPVDAYVLVGDDQNPFVSQQMVAEMIGQLQNVENKPALLKELLKLDQEALGRMMCGLASGIMAVNSFTFEKAWVDVPDKTSITELVLELCQLNASPGINPESKEQLKKGWLVFNNWNIYHHALAYAIEKISHNKLETFGIRNFSIDEVKELLKKGLKVIVSVENSIIPPSRFSSEKFQLNPGTHLISLIGLSEDENWFLMADPYVENPSLYLYFAKPEWIKLESIEEFLKKKDERFGIAITDKTDSGFREKLGAVGYPLAKPGL